MTDETTTEPTADTVQDNVTEAPPASEPVAPAAPPAPFSLATATRTSVRRDPPFMVIYGAEKRGKTTLATSMPNPFLIVAGNERPPADVDVACVPEPVRRFEDLMAWLRTLARDPHEYRTVVLDSLSRIEPLIHDYVCRTVPLNEKGGVAKHIEDYGFGKGYKFADKVWAELVSALSWLNKKRAMGVACLAHATVRKIEEPLTTPFDSYILDMQQRVVDLVKREADAVLFLRENLSTTEEKVGMGKRIKGTGGKLIFAHTTSSPAFTAGTRYRLPEKILIGDGTGYADLVEAGFPQW